jgi:hypothetical protein
MLSIRRNSTALAETEPLPDLILDAPSHDKRLRHRSQCCKTERLSAKTHLAAGKIDLDLLAG